MDVLLDLGYTHCFFVPGGNMMHLLELVPSISMKHPKISLKLLRWSRQVLELQIA
jgi:hypothetical protein